MKSKHKEEETPEESNAIAEPEKKKATQPWSPDNTADSPRKRGMLGLSKTKEGHEVRWVRLDSIDRRKNQGYTLATPDDFDATADENGMIRRNELVLMVVPTEVYLARRKEIARQTEAQTAAPCKEFLREREAASRASGHNLSDEAPEE